MSLFDKMNNSYNKEGKGVYKTDKQKNSFFKFFEIYFSKFWQLVKVNLYFNVVFIPVLVLIATLFIYLADKNINGYLRWFIIFAPTVLLGPVMTGMTKVTRDFVREVPGFPSEDFKSTAAKYIWQSLLFSVVSYLLLWVIIIACIMYYTNKDYGWFYTIGYYVSIFVAAVFLFSSYYIQMMLVTLDLSKKNIVKNAVIFAFLCLPKNLLITVINLLLAGIAGGLLLLGFTYGIEGVCLPILFMYVVFVVFATMSFSMSYLTFPSIKKFIIDPYYEKNPEQTAEVVTNPEKVFKNIGQELEEKELPEYVYENGKLVHRSAIENAIAFHEDDID